jgi:hypothetical protein
LVTGEIFRALLLLGPDEECVGAHLARLLLDKHEKVALLPDCSGDLNDRDLAKACRGKGTQLRHLAVNGLGLAAGDRDLRNQHADRRIEHCRRPCRNTLASCERENAYR